MHVRVRVVTDVISSVIECEMLTCFSCHKFNRPITMCIAQFNLYLIVLVVAITRPAIASHNLARFNPGINPGIKQTQSRNPGIGKTVRDCIPYQ